MSHILPQTPKWICRFLELFWLVLVNAVWGDRKIKLTSVTWISAYIHGFTLTVTYMQTGIPTHSVAADALIISLVSLSGVVPKWTEEMWVQSSNLHLPILCTTQSCWHSGHLLFCLTQRDMQQLWKEWLHSPHTTERKKE